MSESGFDFENSLDEYKGRLSEIKDAAERIVNAGSPLESFRSAVDTVGSPLAIELLKEGIKKRLGQSFGQIRSKLEQAANERIQQLKGDLQGKVGELQNKLEQIKNGTNNQPSQEEPSIEAEQASLRNDVEAKLGRSIEGESSDDVYNELVSGDEESQTLAGRMVGLYNRMTGAEPAMTNTEATASQPSNPTTQSTKYEMPEDEMDVQLPRGANLEMQSFAEESREAGESLTQAADQASSALSGTLRSLTNPDSGGLMGDSTIARALGGQFTSNIGQQVEQQLASNAKIVQNATGLKSLSSAEEAAEGLAKAAPEIGEGEDVGEGIIATGESIAASTGGETEGIGAIVGGLVALGGVLASIFSGHHHEAPPVIPNLSRPVLQQGLGN